VADRLEVGKNNIGNGGKTTKKKELKYKHKNKVMKFFVYKERLM
jgi:hypothetical protein